MKNDTIEDLLRNLDPGTAPVDLAARCRATIPAPRKPLFWLPRRATALRLATALAVFAGFAVWTTWPRHHQGGIPKTQASFAPASAYAAVLETMNRVACWHGTIKQITFEPGDGKAKRFKYNFAAGWVMTETWCDADRGIYNDSRVNDKNIVQRDLLLRNGDMYFRHADRSQGRDTVRLTHGGVAAWQRSRPDRLTERHNPRFWADNFGRSADAPAKTQQGIWTGKAATVFTFTVPPPEGDRANDPPSKRILVYVSSETQRIMARQQYSYWPNHPERGERLTEVMEMTYPTKIDPAIFDPQRFCAGAKKMEEQQDGPSAFHNPD